MKKRYLIIGGVVVIGGFVALSLSGHPSQATAPVAIHHHHPKAKVAPTPKTKSPTKLKPKVLPIPKKYPTIPTSQSASGSVTASFQTVVGQKPPLPLQVVTLPWSSTTQWAIEPLGMSMNGNAVTSPTLWFGEKVGTGKWQWIPTTLPGVPSSHLPPAIRESIIMAYSLHLGEPGPTNTIGNITWQGLQGKVSSPLGWSLAVQSANSSPLLKPTVALTIWQKSYTGAYSGYYGMAIAFDAQNEGNGLHGLAGFVANSGSIANAARTGSTL